MKYVKGSWKGLVFVLVLMGINAIAWITASPIIEQPIESTIGQMMGANLLLWFTLVFFMATKNRFVNWLFTGLENLYTTHRSLAMLTVLMIIVHSQASVLIVQYYREAPIAPATMGLLALYLFLGLTFIALLAKYLNYERWRTIHRFMIIPYLFAVYHAFLLSSYQLLSVSFLGLWMMGLIVVGVGSSIYMIFLYRKTAFPYKGEIVTKTMITDDVTELEVKVQDEYAFKRGQFAFLRIKKKPFKGVPHPFSLSGQTKNTICFTIKAIGDYTKDIKDYLAVGDEIELTKAYGHMVFENHDSPQVWIAGGIGITPFLGHLRSLQKAKETITLYYSVKKQEEAIHLDYFKKLDQEWDNFTFHFSESDKDGFLSVNDLDLSNQPAVFLCGPVPMAKMFKKQFKKIDDHRFLEYEAFSFAGTFVPDIIQLLKRLKHKIKSS